MTTHARKVCMYEPFKRNCPPLCLFQCTVDRLCKSNDEEMHPEVIVQTYHESYVNNICPITKVSNIDISTGSRND